MRLYYHRSLVSYLILQPCPYLNITLSLPSNRSLAHIHSLILILSFILPLTISRFLSLVSSAPCLSTCSSLHETNLQNHCDEMHEDLLFYPDPGINHTERLGSILCQSQW